MKNKWTLWAVMYFAAVCVSFSQLKFVTFIGALIGTMNLSNPGNIGYLMSVFAIAGIILSIPGGFILGKLGPKKLLMCLMVSLLLGNFIGAFAIESFQLMLVSRVLEGVAFAMIIMVGIVLISGWFAGTKIVGTAIGLFVTFPALAAGIILNVSTPISNALGMQSMWLIVGALVLLALILVAVVIPNPAPASDDKGGAPAEAEKPSLSEAASNVKIWFMAICQGCVAFVLFTYIPIYPRLFSDFYGLPPATANFYASLNGWFGIPFCVLAGVIIDKFKNAPLLIFISFICLAAVNFAATLLGPSTYVLHTLLVAIFTGLTISAVLVVAPIAAKRPSLIGYSIAIVNTIYYIGIFAGPITIEPHINSNNWQTGMNILAGVSVLGVAATLAFMMANKKQSAS